MKRIVLIFVIVLGLEFGMEISESDQTVIVAQDTTDLAFGEQSSTPNSPLYPAKAVVHGAYIPTINNYGTEVLAFNNLVGKDLGILMFFPGFYMTPHEYWWLPYQLEKQIPAERRPYIMMGWIPRGRDCRKTPPDQPGDGSVMTSLYDIRDGYCDGYFKLVAQELKVLPFTFMIRFAHEMNLDAVPWWVGFYNKDPQLYIDAYRRIHDVFKSEGVSNVQWVWSPNYASMPREEWNSLFNYYPGDEYVDWIGLSVHNWGPWYDIPWWSLTDMVDSDTWEHVMPELACRYAKPVVLEIGSVDGTRPGDGTKDGWVQQAYQQLEQFPFIKAVVWFNDWDYSNRNGADFRVVGGSYWDPDPWHQGYAYPLPENDGRWTRGYSTAVASDRFISYVPPLEEITPPATYCGGLPAINLPSFVPIVPGKTISLRISVVGLSQDATIFLKGLPPDVTVDFSQTRVLAPWDEVEIQLTVSPDAEYHSLSLTVVLDTGTTVYEKQLTLGDPFRTFLPYTIKPE